MGRLSRTWWQWLLIWGATVLIVLSLAGVALPRSSSTQDYRWVKNSPWVGYSFSERLARVSFPDPLKRQEQTGENGRTDANLYGFINHSGKLVIPPRFFNAKDFSEGLAAVRPNYLDNWKETKLWGFIDQAGRTKVAPRFQYAEGYSNGLAAVMENNKWGYINKQGTYIIPPRFEEANSFHEGIACAVNYVDSNNSNHVEVKYLNRQGKVIKQLTLDTTGTRDKPCTESSGGLIAVSVANTKISNKDIKNYRYGYMNHQGKMVISPKYISAGKFSEGLAGVTSWSGVSNEMTEGGYINQKGRWVISLKDDWAKPGEFHEGLASVFVRGLLGSAKLKVSSGIALNNSLTYGFQEKTDLNSHSKPFQKSRPSQLAGSRLFQENCGYINRKGIFIIQHTLESCSAFQEGWAVVSNRSTNVEGHINRTGGFLNINQAEYFSGELFKEGLAPFMKDSPSGNIYRYIDRQGRTIIKSVKLN
jgi:WG containing repeat